MRLRRGRGLIRVRAPRTLIAGVGYFNLSDLSLGPHIVPELRKQSWPAHVEVDDLSYGPVAVAHRFLEADPPYQRLVVVAAVDRGLSPPKLRCYRWNRVLPEPEEIQARVAEAVTGVVDLDNLLVVVCQFGALPEEVLVVEVQPLLLGPGLALSPTVRALLPEITARLRDIVATSPHELDWVPSALGGLQAQELAR